MKARPTSRLAKPFRPLLGSIAALFAASALTQAGQIWDGGGANGLWSNNLNWNADTLPNFATPLQFGGLLQLAANNDATGSVAGLTFNPGAGAFTLSGNAITLTGGITNSSATLQTVSFAAITLGASQTFLADTGALSVTSPIALGANTLTIDGAQNTTLSGALTGNPGRLTKEGIGTLLLTGTSTYTGQTTINLGTLRAGSTTAFAPMSAFFVSGVLDLGGFSNSVGSLFGLFGGFVQNGGAAPATLTLTGQGSDGSFQGLIQDGTSALSLVKTGPNTQSLSGTNTYTGGTTLQNGALFADSNSALGTGTLTIAAATGATVVLGTHPTSTTLTNPISAQSDFFITSPGAPGDFRLNGPLDLNGGIRVITGTTNQSQIHFGGVISNGGISFTTSGLPAGSVGNAPYVAFIYDGTVPNTYTGLTTVGTGAFLVLQSAPQKLLGDLLIQGNGVADYLGFPDQIADTATVTVNSSGSTILAGTAFKGYELRNFNDTIGALFGSTLGTVGLGSATLTVGAGDFRGVISDGAFGAGGQIAKNTAGFLALSGANVYTGNTTVSGGTLAVAGSIVSPTVTVNGGGDFIAASANAILPAATVNVAAGSGFEYHAQANALLTVGTLTLAGGGGTVLGGSIGSTTTGAEVLVTSAVTPGAGAYIVNVAGISGVTTGAPGVYTLLTAGAGSTLNVGTAYTLGTIYNPTNFTVSGVSATATTLNATIAGAAPLTAAYWLGGLPGNPNVWAASDGTRSNWATNPAGTLTPLVPGAGADVFFSANPSASPSNMTLGANMSIKSLSINAPGAPETRVVTLNDDGYALTLAGTAGITIYAGAGLVTLRPDLVLGASQTWTNNSANLFTAGYVRNGANLLTIAGPGNTTITGVIGNGSGGLTKIDGSTLTLTENNTYTGDTTLLGGALFADVMPGSATNTPFGTGTLVVAGGTLLGSHTDRQTIPNNVSFTDPVAAVTIEAHTHLDFTGNVNLNGGTRTLTGTVHTSEIGFFGVISNGGLTFNTAGLPAPVGGANSYVAFIYEGTAPNTYAGPTTVDSGAFLVLQSAPEKIHGSLLIQGTGVVDYLGFSNQIADNVAVTVNSPGSTISTGTNVKFAGLELRNFSDTIGALFGSAVGTVGLGSGTLTVGRGDFAGVIGDGEFGVGGTLTKNTTGTLRLTGANTFTGNTNINNGTLVLDGSVQSPAVFVNFAGTLMGTGTAAHNVINAGVFSPGHSAGTFHIGGNFAQTAAGTTVIEIAGKNAGEHDLITVGGHATLDGTLRLTKLGNARLKVGDRVVFLTAQNGVSGQYATVNNDFATGTIATAGVIYGANDVAVEIQQGSFAGLGGQIQLTPNQKSVGALLDRVVGERGERKLIDFLNGEPLAKLPHDFDLIAPEELQALYSIGHAQANVQTANLQRRLEDVRAGVHGFSAEGLSVSGTGEQAHAAADPAAPLAGVNGPTGAGGKELRAPETPAAPAAPRDRRFGAFITGVGEFANVGDTKNARGYDLATGGFTLGADYRLSENLTAGLNTGYARSGADLAGGGRVTVDGAKLGAYATWFNEGLYVDAAVQGGYNSYSTRRTALRGSASGSTTGGEVNALIATGFDFTSDALRIGPTASFQYTHIGLSGFRESGSLAPLTYPSQGSDSTRTAIGMKAAYEFRLASGVVVRPEARAAWQHEFGDIAYAVDSRLANGGGNIFTVHGSEIGRDSALLGLGVAVLWSERTAAYLYYDGEVGRSNYTSNNISGGVRMTF